MVATMVLAEVVQLMDYWWSPDGIRWSALPDRYLVIDIETTGLEIGTDLIIQFGWVGVTDREIVSEGSVFLDWTRESRVDQEWLRQQLAAVAERMAEKGHTCPHDYARLSQEGGEPISVLQSIAAMLAAWDDQETALVGHNLYTFDLPHLAAHFEGWLEQSGVPWGGPLVDTGLIVKAAQLQLFPWPEEGLEEWYVRVRDYHTRVRWALPWCMETLGIAVDPQRQSAHSADYDAYMTYRLLEHCRAYGMEGVCESSR